MCLVSPISYLREITYKARIMQGGLDVFNAVYMCYNTCMPFKVVLVQITDLERYASTLESYSGFASEKGTPLFGKDEALRFLKRSRGSLVTPYPMGPLALAAFARKRFGSEVELSIIDMLTERLFVEDLVERLKRESPDLVGLSSFSAFSGALHRAAALIKAELGVPVAAGGPYCSASTERAARDPNIDCVAYGEGELSFVEMIDRLMHKKDLKGIPGTAYLEGGRVVVVPHSGFIEDLDDLPFPAVDLLRMEDYFLNLSPLGYLSPWMILFNSRGCPYRCIYCHSIFGKRTRFMSPKRVFDEMMFYYKTYGIREFQVWDDIFNLDVGRAIEVCDLIHSAGSPFRLLFEGGLRADIMRRELVEAMVRAGTCHICYAVESGSPRIQAVIKKYLDLEKAAEAINYTADRGILVNTYNMLGLPTETEEEMYATIEYNVRLRHFSIRLFHAIPQEGTEFYEMVYPKGRDKGETGMYLDHRHEGADSALYRKVLRDGLRRFYLDAERIERISRMQVPTMSPSEVMRAYAMEFRSVFNILGIRRIYELPPGVVGPVMDVFRGGGVAL